MERNSIHSESAVLGQTVQSRLSSTILSRPLITWMCARSLREGEGPVRVFPFRSIHSPKGGYLGTGGS